MMTSESIHFYRTKSEGMYPLWRHPRIF